MKERELPTFDNFENSGWDVYIRNGKYVTITKDDVEIKIKKDGNIIIKNWPDNERENKFSDLDLKQLDKYINLFRRYLEKEIIEVNPLRKPEVQMPKGPIATQETPMEVNIPKGPDASIKEVIETRVGPTPEEYDINVYEHGNNNGAYKINPKGPDATIKKVKESPNYVTNEFPERPDNEMGPECPVEVPERKDPENDDDYGIEM